MHTGHELDNAHDAQMAISSLLKLSLEDIPLDTLLERSLKLLLDIPWLEVDEKGGILLAEESGVLRLTASHGLARQVMNKCAMVPLGTCLCGRAAAEQKTYFADTIDERHEIRYRGMPPHGHYCMPIISDEKTLGVINLYLKEGHRRDSDEEEFLTSVANTLAGVIKRRQAEDRLRQSEARYRLLFEQSSDIMVQIDRKGNIIDVNRRARDLAGYTREDLTGRKISALSHIFTAKSMALILKNFARRMMGADIKPYEIEAISKDGRKLFFELSAEVLENSSGQRTGELVLLHDITERKLAEESIRQLAYHDSLTGLPNRRLFNDRLFVAQANAQRHGKNVAVMMLDLDFFKQINDSLGHTTGDNLLKSVAARLSSLLRKGDTVARMGGDEFLLLLPEIGSEKDAVKTAEKILSAFRTSYTFDGHVFHITPSIGIALFPADGDDIDTLVKNADTAMYQVKESGRNGYQLYSDNNPSSCEG